MVRCVEATSYFWTQADRSTDSDYNFVRHNDECVPVGPEPIPAGVCRNPDQVYRGSSGYRIIPGNTCDRDRGVKKNEPVEKKCSQGKTYLARPS
jgi:Sortilin, neurotensin receptor 3, C-terminal